MRIAGSLRLGVYVKTRVRIHYTWLLVFLLIPWSVSTQFSTDTDLVTRIVLGIITAILFFFGIFLREILLLLIADMKKVHVQVLTIFAFGGLVQADPETETPALEMLFSVSGMLLNFIITIIFYFSSWFVSGSQSSLVDIPLKWLAFFFFTLSLFHFLPAYPLEGGRMLHVLFRKLTGDLRKAMRISGISGWVLGFLTMTSGVLLAVYTSELFSGLFFIGLGLIIQNAATHGLRSIRSLPLPKQQASETDAGEPLISWIIPEDEELPQGEVVRIMSEEIYGSENTEENKQPDAQEPVEEENNDYERDEF